MSPEATGARRGFKVRDLETILPILTTVDELNLTVEAPAEEDYCYLMLSWIRSILNQREIPLRKATIGVYNDPDRGTFNEAEKIHALNQPQDEVWLLEPARRDNAQGPPKGTPYRDTYINSIYGYFNRPHRDDPREPDHLPQSMAWRNLIYGKTHYWVDTWTETNEIVVEPKRRWMLALLVSLCDLLDMLWFHDFQLGRRTGCPICCPFCYVIHIGSHFDSRIGALGWPSTRAYILEREADRSRDVQRRLQGDTASAETYSKLAGKISFSRAWR